MLNYKIVRASVTQNILDIINPLVCKSDVDGIHNRNLFIKNDIRIIRHSVFYDVLSFKKVNVVVVDADILYILCNFH